MDAVTGAIVMVSGPTTSKHLPEHTGPPPVVLDLHRLDKEKNVTSGESTIATNPQSTLAESTRATKHHSSPSPRPAPYKVTAADSCRIYYLHVVCANCENRLTLAVLSTVAAIRLLQQQLTENLKLLCPHCEAVYRSNGRR